MMVQPYKHKPYLGLLLTIFVFFTSLSTGHAQSDQWSNLTRQLKDWQNQAEQIIDLEKNLRTLDVSEDAGNEERYWWNPFWRAGQERHFQEINQLTLTLAALKKQQTQTAGQLKLSCQSFIDNLPQWIDRPSPELLSLWTKVDRWRFNYLSNHLRLKDIARQLSQLQDKELIEKRLVLLNEYADAVRRYLEYIDQYSHYIEPDNKTVYIKWQKNLEQASVKIENLRKKAELLLQ